MPPPPNHFTFTCFRLLFLMATANGNNELEAGQGVRAVQSWGREQVLAAYPAEAGSEPVSPPAPGQGRGARGTQR